MFSIFRGKGLAAASLRDRVFVLLLAAILFGAATSVVSIWALDHSGRVSQAAIRRELSVSQTLGSVATRHLEQAAAVDAAVRVASWQPRPASPAEAERVRLGVQAERARFEEEARTMWAALHEVRDLLSPGDDPIGDVDLAHNEYAAAARSVFALLERGELKSARLRIQGLEAPQARFEVALGRVLDQVRARSEDTILRLDGQRRTAIAWVGALTVLALLGGFAVLLRAIHLVGEVRSLEGLLPICAQCKAIRDDRGYWNQIEAFVEAHSSAQFTHGLCESCVGNVKAEVTRAKEQAQAPVSPCPVERGAAGA